MNAADALRLDIAALGSAFREGALSPEAVYAHAGTRPQNVACSWASSSTMSAA